MTNKMILTRGVPASGKSTWSKAWVLAGEKRARVNRDNLRWMVGIKEGVGTYEQEQLVTDYAQAQARVVLSKGYDVVVDETNLRAKNVKQWMKFAKENGAEVEFKDFVVDRETAKFRDLGRRLDGERFVGADVIDSFFDRFLGKNGELPAIPTLDEDELPVFKPYIADDNLPEAFLVDTDGTVADMAGLRGPYDTSRYHLDQPVVDVIRLVNILADAGIKIIALSGRSDEFRSVTEKWWLDNGLYFDEFYMRAAGDTRNDSLVKSEIFDGSIADRYNVIGAIDDRLRVARMWHGKGITLYRVGDPDADF